MPPAPTNEPRIQDKIPNYASLRKSESPVRRSLTGEKGDRMHTNYTQMSDTLGPRKISPFGATDSLPNLSSVPKPGNFLRTRSSSKRKTQSLRKGQPANLQTKYPKKGQDSHPSNLTDCWKKIDKMQSKITKFDKKLSK